MNFPGRSDAARTKIAQRKKAIHSLKAKANAKRNFWAKMADWLTMAFGSMTFLIGNFIWFGLWILFNSGWFMEPFDPFPFGLLTMIVSLEAIFLAIIVLISQNRGAKTAELREEMDLQMDIIAEEEITKILEIVIKIAEKNQIDLTEDKQVRKMLKPVNREYIEQVLAQQVES